MSPARPRPAFAGAVFDLNGTLVDDIAFHVRAWRELGVRLGYELDDARFQRDINGLKNEDIFPKLLGRPVSAEEVASLGEEKERLYRAAYRPVLAPVRGAEELLASLRGRGVKLAVASSAPPENRAMVLDALDWWKAFDVVVAAEGLRGKPAPDIFLAAASQLGVAPERCVAFEDAPNGVKSAAAAGMLVVGITTNNDEATLRAAGASHVAPDFTSLDLAL